MHTNSTFQQGYIESTCSSRQAPESKRVVDNYMGDMDLPSSESEPEEETVSNRVEEKKDVIKMAQVRVLHATRTLQLPK